MDGHASPSTADCPSRPQNEIYTTLDPAYNLCPKAMENAETIRWRWRERPVDLMMGRYMYRTDILPCQESAIVIPPPDGANRVTRFLKPNLLRIYFTNKYLCAQVVHSSYINSDHCTFSNCKLSREAGETKHAIDP
ncbi:hypothetical protein EJB05_47104, partial [Eragrostis curvula]